MAEIDLRGPGRWQDLLRDDEHFDVCITDPPYGNRAMTGFRSGNQYRAGVSSTAEVAYSYDCWTPGDVAEFVAWVTTHVKHWAVVFNDDDTAFLLRQAFRESGWYAFGDVPWCKSNGPPRFQGDGPASSVEHITIARPTKIMPSSRISSRPGYYVTRQQNGGKRDSIVTGQKPLDLMRALVRDYTLKTDTIVDPFCGSGSTAIAAAQEGRNVVTCELNPETLEKTQARLARGWTADIFSAERRAKPKTKRMF